MRSRFVSIVELLIINYLARVTVEVPAGEANDLHLSRASRLLSYISKRFFALRL